jgi:acetyl-CoA acetyltransferase
MSRKNVAIVGAAETDRIGVVPDMGQVQLHCNAALRAMSDAGLTAKDIDGIACAEEVPWTIAAALGITPTWVDGTDVGGCAYMHHLRHAVAAIQAGHATTILITHGESGRSKIGTTGLDMKYTDNHRQFELPYGATMPPTMFTLPVRRFMYETGLTSEHLAWVHVRQREWAARNPRAMLREPVTVDEVLSSSMIADPITKLMCCLVTDAGGAVIVTSAERAKDLHGKPVYYLGGGETVSMNNISQMSDFTRADVFETSSRKAFEEAGITAADVDHLMIYDAFAHLPIYGLEALGFVGRGEAGDFIKEGNTAPGGKLPLNTNGGGLCYTHPGRYGMFALQESIRQLRGTAPAQVDGVEISVAQGVGGMFFAAATAVLTNVP